MPFWSRKDNSDRDDKPKNRETGINDAYPLEEIGSPQFLERVGRIAPVLAHEINTTDWIYEIDFDNKPQFYFLQLTKTLYRILSSEKTDKDSFQDAQFEYLEEKGTLVRKVVKAYLQIKPEHREQTEAIARDLQRELLTKVKNLHGKYDANPNSSRRERIIFYFNSDDRGNVLTTLRETAKPYLQDPGKLRDVSPSVIPGLNYATESNVAWDTFVQYCIPDKTKIDNSYRYVLAFFCAIELAEFFLAQHGGGDGKKKSPAYQKLERYVSTVKTNTELFPNDPSTALHSILTLIQQTRS